MHSQLASVVGVCGVNAEGDHGDEDNANKVAHKHWRFLFYAYYVCGPLFQEKKHAASGKLQTLFCTHGYLFHPK